MFDNSALVAEFVNKGIKKPREKRLTKNLKSQEDQSDNNDSSSIGSHSSNDITDNDDDSDFCLSESEYGEKKSTTENSRTSPNQGDEYEKSRQKNVDEKMAFLKSLNFSEIHGNLKNETKKIKLNKKLARVSKELPPQRSSQREGRKQVCYKEEDIPTEESLKKMIKPPKAKKRTKSRFEISSDSESD